MSGRAHRVRWLERAKGVAALYRVDPVYMGHTHVIVSAVEVPEVGPETYAFPATAAGDVTSFLELPCSFRGALDHAECLRRAGYEVTP